MNYFYCLYNCTSIKETLNGHFEKTYHNSAIRPTVYGVKWSLTFFFWPKKRYKQEEVNLSWGRYFAL